MNRSPTFYIWWKEVRAVLPLFGVALVALVLPTIAKSVWSNWFAPDDWRLVVYPVGVVALVASIFTREFQDQTILSQLLLPQSRFTPLMRKICVALLLQLFLTIVYLLVLTQREWKNPDVVWTFAIGVNAVALAGGCFWGIITKQGAATVAISIAFPWITGIIGVGFAQWFGLDLGSDGEYRIMLTGFGVYTVVCALGAAVAWNCYQVKGDTVTVSKLDTSLLSRLSGRREFVKHTRWIALTRKELGIQRFCFWLTVIMIVCATVFTIADFLIGMSIQATDGSTAAGNRALDLQSILRAFGSALFVIFLGTIPVLAAAQAFAEESHLGNRVWQQTLPVSTHCQCALKLGTAASISTVLGLVLPIIVAWGYATLRMGKPFFPGFPDDAIPSFLLMHALVFCTTVWCATWSSTTISAIMKSVLVLLAFTVTQAWLTSVLGFQNGAIYSGEQPDWRWAGLGVIPVLIWLTFSNHSQTVLGKRRVLGQIIALVIVVVGVMFIDSGI